MKKSKFSEEQVVRIVREAESGKRVREVCRAHGVSEPTFYVEVKSGGLVERRGNGLRIDISIAIEISTITSPFT
jgi:transposase-like protein